MKTLSVGFPFKTVHFIETFDPKFASVGPDIVTSGGPTVHTSYNLNVTRVYHACVDHEMHTLFCYTRVVSCVFISYTTNT